MQFAIYVLFRAIYSQLAYDGINTYEYIYIIQLLLLLFDAVNVFIVSLYTFVLARSMLKEMNGISLFIYVYIR